MVPTFILFSKDTTSSLPSYEIDKNKIICSFYKVLYQKALTISRDSFSAHVIIIKMCSKENWHTAKILIGMLSPKIVYHGYTNIAFTACDSVRTFPIKPLAIFTLNKKQNLYPNIWYCNALFTDTSAFRHLAK